MYEFMNIFLGNHFINVFRGGRCGCGDRGDFQELWVGLRVRHQGKF